MRKEWMEPVIEVQEFVANEYVASCGESGKVYNFECNAGKSENSYYVYTNGADGLPGTSDDVRLGGYHPCGKTHSAESDSDFAYGYMYRIYGYDWLGRPQVDRNDCTNVIIWRGEDGNNIHCTTNLDINSWETAKS